MFWTLPYLKSSQLANDISEPNVARFSESAYSSGLFVPGLYKPQSWTENTDSFMPP